MPCPFANRLWELEVGNGASNTSTTRPLVRLYPGCAGFVYPARLGLYLTMKWPTLFIREN